jgi:hypothetical protein
MGWLFAVALGLHRQDRGIVYLSLLPIAAGHALSVALAVAAFVWAGVFINARAVSIGAGLLLLGWALYHWRYGHRHRVRVGMQAGLAALALWSFLMATAHGAGLMLWPVLMPLCSPAAGATAASNPLATAIAGVGVHTLSMLAVTGAMAFVIYEWLGIDLLRRAWINVDLIWMLALVITGMVLLLSS